MLAIEVELLQGRYAATAYNDRNRAEWPPHPARFFSALVAGLYDQAPPDPDEREALLWLERQPPPALAVDLHAAEREVHDVYVPVNDVTLVGDPEAELRSARQELARAEAGPGGGGREAKSIRKAVEKEEAKLAGFLAKLQQPDPEPSQSDLKKAVALLPDRRTRQVRTFPVAIPEHPRFSFIWSAEAPAPVQASLGRLCERVTRLGHSSSLVRCALLTSAPAPTLVPDDEGEVVLRTVGEGQLERLDRAFEHHQGVLGRTLPARPQRYGVPRVARRRPAVRSAFSEDWVVFERVGGARPLSSRGTDLTRALRAALLEQQGTRPMSGILSGHQTDGAPIGTTHAAFIALPFVGRPHADASVQGCAIVLPRDAPYEEREALLRLVAGWEQRCAVDTESTVELSSGTLPVVRLRRTELSAKSTLRPVTWSRSSRRFITATPIALDRNPGNLRSNLERTAHRAAAEAQRCIADACEHIGLPRPESVEVSLVPLLPGGQPVRAFLPWPARAGRTPRVRVHADLRFAEPVQGPVLLGAGRYFGLGLCLPVSDEVP